MRFLLPLALSAMLAACGGEPAAPPAPAPAPAPAPVAAPEPPPEPKGPEYPPGIDLKEGHDFAREVKILYNTLACGDVKVKSDLNKDLIAKHCEHFNAKAKEIQDTFVHPMKPFLVSLHPPKREQPKEAFYPFAGGDLLSLLTTYPDASILTTISLENAGDPRKLPELKKKELDVQLEYFRQSVARLLFSADMDAKSVTAMQKGPLPGQLAYVVTALKVHGYEPVALRFFQFSDDGTLDYLDLEEISELESERTGRLGYVSSDFSVAFRNSEVLFKPIGKDGPIQAHRHIAANIHNSHMRENPGLVNHLKNKGDFLFMVKAGNYLMWDDGFTDIRNIVLDQMTFGISDSTGILPRHARDAGFTQTTYGEFNGAFLDNKGGAKAQELRELWASQPKRDMPWRFGYSDTKGAPHLIVYTKGPGPAGKGGKAKGGKADKGAKGGEGKAAKGKGKKN